MSTFNHPSQSSKSNKRPWLIAASLCAALAVLAVVLKEGSPAKDAAASPSSAKQKPHSKPSSSTGFGSEFAAAPNTEADKSSSSTASETTRPTDTRANHRDTVTNSKGERKKVIDPIASWNNPPAWPEGARLFAEVETNSRKYVNLRPDDIGEMPRILADAEERIELKISIPEGTPGEKIYVEIPNGGSFPDSDQFGRTFELSENRTLSIPYITDDARGYCTVVIRQGGHNRSLPIWVGEPPKS